MECEVPRELPTTRCDNPAALEATCARIEALSVVNGRVLFLPKHNQGVGRIKVNVWCRSSHESSRDKQPYVDLNNRKAGDDGAVPTWDVAAQKLLTLIETKHVGCVEAAEAARMAAAAQSAAPASGSSSGTRPEPSVDAFQAMMVDTAKCREAGRGRGQCALWSGRAVLVMSGYGKSAEVAGWSRSVNFFRPWAVF